MVAAYMLHMPRFYFDVRDGVTVMLDDTGLDLDSIDEATEEAARTLGEIAREVLPRSVMCELAIEVRDADQQPLLSTTLRFEVQRMR
jgi:hypothetical protein